MVTVSPDHLPATPETQRGASAADRAPEALGSAGGRATRDLSGPESTHRREIVVDTRIDELGIVDTRVEPDTALAV